MLREKISKLLVELNQGLIEREEVMKVALLSLIAKENIILVGPPGTAKSEISRRLLEAIKVDNYFEYLLTKFTTPEEIFGPLSIKELKEDKFKRNTDGYMPNAEIVFLDEIFKANSSILNSLLSIINEKIFHNGREKQKVPLLSLVGASNELPVNEEELKALYDRFLVRKVVNYVSDENIYELMNISNKEFKISEENKITTEEIEEIHKNAETVKLEKDIMEILKEIREKYNEEFKENSIENISDRRFLKIIKFLKIATYTNNRVLVNKSDLLLLRYCLWNSYENIEKIDNLIKEVIVNKMTVDEINA